MDTDARFRATITRDCTTGNYTPEFAAYFKEKQVDIQKFIADKKHTMTQQIADGLIQENEPIDHQVTSNRMRTVLYGINLWANEQDVDLTLHVHFNNYPRTNEWQGGAYQGYAIYTPELQYVNSLASMQVAQNLHAKLSTVFQKSTSPLERDTIIPSQELIAVGAFHTRNTASILVEYGYIYEPFINTEQTRSNQASLTYQALTQSFFPQ